MAAKKPTHYAVTLSQPFPVPNSAIVVPAGESTLSAAIVALIPAETILDKRPAEA